jgi:hypothetical protein
MRKIYAAAFALLLLGNAGCGDGDGNAPSPTYESISGSYAGILAGVSQGVALNSDIALTITQSGGSLSGSYAIDGTLSNGIEVVSISGTGNLTGSIASGNNPSVNITVTPGSCPSQTARFSGAYDSANQRLTISGPVEFFDSACQVVLTYSSTIILSR